jgi:hypothetical protein
MSYLLEPTFARLTSGDPAASPIASFSIPADSQCRQSSWPNLRELRCSLLLLAATPAEERGLKEAADSCGVPCVKVRARESRLGVDYYDLGPVGNEIGVSDPVWCVVKGISDFADENRDAVIEANRPVACRNAGLFVLSDLSNDAGGGRPTLGV